MDTRGIPHPSRRLPLLGDVLAANPRTPVQASIRLARELGPIYSGKLLRWELLVVSSAELSAELSDETRFTKHVSLSLANLRAVTGDGLLTAYNSEPNWRLAHAILLPAFGRQAMHGYHPTMLGVAKELLASWDQHIDGAPVDVAADMTRLTLETIGRTGFGYRFGSFAREEPHPFVTSMNDALRQAHRSAVQLPLFGRLFGNRLNRQVSYMNRLVDEVIRMRRECPDPDDRDLLGLMLQERHPETGERLTDLNIRNQVITFLIAGHETTAGALSFALYYLTRNPEALRKAQSEVDALWGESGDPEPSYDEVVKLRYVRRVLDESLRLWPTAPAYARMARDDTLLDGRYPMRAGEWAMVLLNALHRDPSVWGPDPEAFDPNRFSPERVRQRPAHCYKPFGTGERSCIGRQFAIHEAVLVLGLLVHRYELSPEPDYQLRISEQVTLKPDGFLLTLRRRAGRRR
ncbi:MAG: cytochrome P450 [Streptomyces sp.]|uniref:cytochrome P450 n=1 Tax=Streptomyces sp. TaxID=1931 RepID=UPI003D6AF209